MWEYKIITGSDKDNQMKLNQWRHKYDMNVITMCPRGDGTTILLSRLEFDPFPIEERKSSVEDFHIKDEEAPF